MYLLFNSESLIGLIVASLLCFNCGLLAAWTCSWNITF